VAQAIGGYDERPKGRAGADVRLAKVDASAYFAARFVRSAV
jgi:hypothetical protein